MKAKRTNSLSRVHYSQGWHWLEQSLQLHCADEPTVVWHVERQTVQQPSVVLRRLGLSEMLAQLSHHQSLTAAGLQRHYHCVLDSKLVARRETGQHCLSQRLQLCP